MSREIGRLLTAMVTPFSPDGEVDYIQAKALANRLIESGSDGLIIAGTTGESPNLTLNEKLRLFAEVKAAIGDGVVIAGTGTYSTRESIELTKQVEGTGVDGVMAVVPYYNKPPQEGLFQHFQAIAGATSLPLIVYNVPSRTGLNMTDETTIRLSQIENIIGVKEAGSDMDQVVRILSGARPDFKVWSGNDNETFPIVSLGGYGVISVASHLVGVQIKEMINLVLDGQIDKAACEHLRLHPLFKILFVISSPIPVKYALKKIGFPVGETRLPLIPPDDRTIGQIDAVLAEYSFDLGPFSK